MTKAKYLVVLFAIALLMLVFPNIVSAATIQATETTTTSTGKTVNWSYELDSNNNILNLKCTNISSISGDVIIPSTIDGYTVLTIGNTAEGLLADKKGAFEACSGLTGITIPNTVTTIGYRAFYNCTGLKTVTIPESVVEIAEGVFYEVGLTEITLPESLTTIGKGAFQHCTGLKTITIPNNVNSMGANIFSGCTGLQDITISDNVTSIEDEVFNGCTGLKEITIPDSVTSIGEYAFSGCTGLKTVTIPNNVSSIGYGAFAGCSGLSNVTLSESVTKIANNTFRDCSGLTSIIIPESVTTIEGGYSWQGAFGNCTRLEKILIPDSVASIGENAFVDCDKLTIYGNDGQASKTYAEENNINFKYIYQWNEADIGDDITPPHVESIEVPYSSVSDYYDSNSTTYVVLSGKVLIINVKFNENILATEVPSLTIRFGSGSHIVLTEGTVSGSTVAYTYTIANGDVGTMAVVSLAGGNVTDEAGNEATLSCPELRVTAFNHYIYANGTAINPDNGGNSDGDTDNGSGTGTGSESDSGKGNEAEEITINRKQYANHTYYIFEKNMTWEEAKLFCEQQGGHLVTITSEEEQKFIQSYIKENNLDDKRFWIGGKGTDKNWIWITGENFNYSNWGKGQPDLQSQSYAVLHAYETTYNGTQHIAVGQWDNLQGEGDTESNNIYFICEWEAETENDKTIAPEKLPAAGLKIGMISVVSIMIIAAIIMYFKYNKLRGI